MELLPTPERITVTKPSLLNVTPALRQAFEQSVAGLESVSPINLVLDQECLTGTRVSDACRAQGYRLDITGEGILIAAPERAGLYYGLQTLRQILWGTPDHAPLPCIRVSDWPDMPWRGLQLDIARGMSYRHDHVKEIVRTMGSLKLNMLHLYLEGRFAYPSHPELHEGDLMTPDQARDLTRFAAEHNVTLIPQVNALGHMAGILGHEQHRDLREDPDDPYMICPSHPDALPFVLTLVDDLADAFEGPFLHIGMDEVGKLGSCERCRQRVRQDGHAGSLLADHINAIAAHLKTRGRRPLIWGDMLLDKMRFPGTHAANGGITGWGSRNQTVNALETLDRDVIICDWQYATFSPSEMTFLRDRGFDIMAAIDSDERGCPWGPAHGIDSHLQNMFESAKETGALGAYTCTWSLCMGEVFHNRWLDFAKTAETLWSHHAWEGDEIADRVGRVLFGIEGALLRRLDAGIKRDVLPSRMRLVPNLMNLDRPWAVLEPPKGAEEPVGPLADIRDLVAFKEQMLLRWRRLLAMSQRQQHLLQAMDLPLRVDLAAAKMFALKQGLKTTYTYAASHAHDPLVEAWCRDSVLTGLSMLRDEVSALRNRLEDVHAAYGNNISDVTRARRFEDMLADLIRTVEAQDGLPPLADWCPEALR